MRQYPVKLARLSVGIAVIVALSAFAAVLLQHHSSMSNSFWPNFLGVIFAIGICSIAITLEVRSRSKSEVGRISAILEQFPGPITLSSSSSHRMMVGIVLAAGMTAVCLVIGAISFFGWHMHRPQPEGLVIMLPCSAFFAFYVRRGLIQLIYGWLRLDAIGFELAGATNEQYCWNDVGDFRAERAYRFANVGFRVRLPKGDPEALLNLRFTGGRDVWLPDNYGFKLEDLAQLMTAWQSRATQTNSS